MRRIFRKLAKSTPELVGRFTVRDVVLEIAVDNNLMVGLVNGYRVVDGQLADDPIDKMVGTLASVAAKLVRDNWGDDALEGAITMYPSEWDSAGKYPSERYMKAMVSRLREHLDDKTVVIANEGKIQEPAKEEAPTKKIQIDLRTLVSNLNQYNKSLAECLKYADRSIERASILLARRVSATMWGADKLQAQLDKVSRALPALESGLEEASKRASLSLRSSEEFVSRLRRGVKGGSDDEKYMKQVLIPGMLSYHEKVSSYLSSVVADLSVLANLDRVVRNTTGYPASFMFKVSLADDLNEAYTILVAFLTDIPAVEKGIFEPLEYIQHGTFTK